MSKTKDEFIPIAAAQTPSAPPARLVSLEEFNQHRRILNWTFGFIVAVLVVCFTSFVVFIIDAWRFHSDITTENSRVIEQLRSENQDLKVQALAKRVEELEKELSVRAMSQMKTKTGTSEKQK